MVRVVYHKPGIRINKTRPGGYEGRKDNDMRYRYYSTQRPFGPGTYPRQDGTECYINFFGGKIFCEEINREAWGFIEYREPITPEAAAEYELTTVGEKDSKVLEGTDSNGRTVAFVVDAAIE